jgi:hypothetical protein
VRFAIALPLLLAACVGDDPITSSNAASDGGPDATAPGPAPDGGTDAAAARKRVFASSTKTVAKFAPNGGIEAADAICQTHATNAGLGGTFVAWLSDSATHASDRVDDEPFYLVDGTTLVAAGKTALVTGTLAHGIDRDEKNMPVTGNAWTGTGSDGRRTDEHCNDWSAGGGTTHGTVGVVTATNGAWTSDTNTKTQCNSPEPRLYCFEL